MNNDTIHKTGEGMTRIILVSNRLPVSVEKRKGQYRYRQSMGGSATDLSTYHFEQSNLWIGWSGLLSGSVDSIDRKKINKELRYKYHCLGLYLSKIDHRLFYSGFCNKTIWPLFHYFTDFVKYDDRYWESYVRVNELFCRTIMKHAKNDDIIWILDYHLMLLPQMIRKHLPDCRIGFFLHIPFSSYEIFRLLPWRDEVLKGLLGADLIGFHTYDYMRHFISSIRHISGLEHQFGHIQSQNRLIKVDAFPMGIDYDCDMSVLEGHGCTMY